MILSTLKLKTSQAEMNQTDQDFERTMSQEKKKVDRGSFLEIADRAWTSLVENGNLPNSLFLDAYNAYFEIVVADDFQFAYDHVQATLKEWAPKMKEKQFLDAGKQLARLTAYMHRFEIPHRNMASVWDMVLAESARCLPN